jgi:hypothetical protein
VWLEEIKLAHSSKSEQAGSRRPGCGAVRDCGGTWVLELGASKYKLIVVVGSTVTVQEEKGRRRCPFFYFCDSSVKLSLYYVIDCVYVE